MASRSVFSVLGSIAAPLAGITLICYLIGVLTINSYLYLIGFSDFLSTLDSRFVYTGVVVLSTLLFSTLFPLEVYRNIRSGKGAVKILMAICAFIFSSLVYLGINFFFVYFCVSTQDYFLFIDPVNSLFRDAIYTRNVVLQLSIYSSLTGFICLLILKNMIPGRSNLTEKVSSWKASETLLVLLLIPVLSLYITFWGKRIYPLIPEQYGGGLPKLVQILFEDSNKEGLQSLGIKIADTGLSFESHQRIAILFESENTYLLSVCNIEQNKDKTVLLSKETVILNKDLVKGMKIKPLLRIPELT